LTHGFRPAATKTYGLRLPGERKSAGGFFSFLGGKAKKTQGSGNAREARISYAFRGPENEPGPEGKGFLENKAGRRWGSWGGVKWVFRIAALLAMIGLAAWGKNQVLYLLQDATGFKLVKVSVEGNRFLRTEDVLKAAALCAGENMFKLDLTGAARKLEGLDWVEKAFLERRLPQTVLISIKERKPVALLDSGALYGVTREGRVLSASEELAQLDLPLLSGVKIPSEALGTTALASALKPGLDFLVFAQKEDGGMAQEVSEVNLADPLAMKVTFIDGITATFNDQVTSAELRRLGMVRADLAHKGLRAGTMDFRYKDTVLVKVM
jgi:cell division protein FtsQ